MNFTGRIYPTSAWDCFTYNINRIIWNPFQCIWVYLFKMSVYPGDWRKIDNHCLNIPPLTHANNLPCAWAAAMRLQAMSKYLGSISMPMNLRPRFAQATPVVPEPMKGSRTVSPSHDARLTSHIITQNNVMPPIDTVCRSVSAFSRTKRHKIFIRPTWWPKAFSTSPFWAMKKPMIVGDGHCIAYDYRCHFAACFSVKRIHQSNHLSRTIFFSYRY